MSKPLGDAIITTIVDMEGFDLRNWHNLGGGRQ
jgi:hypothetical protein